MSNISDLLHLAAKSRDVTPPETNSTEEARRLVGRLARNLYDCDSVCEVVVHLAKCGSLPDGMMTVLLLSIIRVLEIAWESDWEEVHPDRPGEAWEGRDPDLLYRWRQKAVTVITECHQQWILEVQSADEYIQKLIKAHVKKETAEMLADWLAEVRCAEEGGQEQ